MNESSQGALGIPELMPPHGGGSFIVNLHAPTGKRAAMNESNQGALGILELMPPHGGGSFIVNLHVPTSERAAMNESSQSALGIPELMPPGGGSFIVKRIHIFAKLEKIIFRTALSFVKGCFSLCPEYDSFLIKYTTLVSFCQQKTRNLSDVFAIAIQISPAHFLKYLLSVGPQCRPLL
ncbi:MAG: hypothetical protein HFG14_00410 [Lachnospiraceae bacterium]|jgi:hypothetical protein|nr:hypothetical protein [Lachnospiraceae bacterium]